MDGEITCTPEELGEEDTLDATWLWVNGSDSRWAGEMATWRKVHNVYSPERHFREQNELKYSMRSVVKALEGHIRTCHLILYDYAFDVQRDVDLLPQSTIDLLEDEMKHHRADRSSAERYNGTSETEISNALASHLSENWRVSQTPTWLDFSKLDPNSPDHPAEQSPHNESETQWRGEVKYPQLRYAAHSEIFHLPTRDRADIDDAGETEWREKEWRKKALPSYNSMAIESRIGWLPGLADVALALNDDFFILRPHAVSDFHSPLYGNVVRFDWGVSFLCPNRFANLTVVPTGPPGSRRGPFQRRWRAWWSVARKLLAVATFPSSPASLLCACAQDHHSQSSSRGQYHVPGGPHHQWLAPFPRGQVWGG